MSATPTAAQAWPGLITPEGCRHSPVPFIPSFKLPFSIETKFLLPAKATGSGTFHPQASRIPPVSAIFATLLGSDETQANCWS